MAANASGRPMPPARVRSRPAQVCAVVSPSRTAARSRGSPRCRASREMARAISGAVRSKPRKSSRRTSFSRRNPTASSLAAIACGSRKGPDEPGGQLARAGTGDRAVDGGEQAALPLPAERAQQLQARAAGRVDDEAIAGPRLARRPESRAPADLRQLDIFEEGADGGELAPSKTRRMPANLRRPVAPSRAARRPGCRRRRRGRASPPRRRCRSIVAPARRQAVGRRRSPRSGIGARSRRGSRPPAPRPPRTRPSRCRSRPTPASRLGRGLPSGRRTRRSGSCATWRRAGCPRSGCRA